MKLYYSRASPFARKVRASAILLGLERRIELIEADPFADPRTLHEANPLGLVPTLVTEDGFGLFDSAVICEYLNDVASDLPLIPPSGAARWSVLRLQAMADGMMNAAVLRRKLASLTEASGDSRLARREQSAVRRTLDVLEQQPPGRHVDIGSISVGCALGFLDLRFAGEPWREDRPRLASWFEEFARQDCMRLTHSLA